jgi:hydrogenase expression/formation protein HypE
MEALQDAGCEDAAIIGEVREHPSATVLGMTAYGGTRVIDMLAGDPLPRIC